jgi:hypothetical protein
MEIKKLKKLLAEGNPEKQLENIIEDLAEASQIPWDRQILRVNAKEGIENKVEAELNKLKIEAQMIISSGQIPPPSLTNEIRKLEGELKNREAQTGIAQSFVKETLRGKTAGKRDHLTGEQLEEGETMDKVKSIKFGVTPPSKPKTDTENKITNKEDFTMNEKQKALFEQTMSEMFKILKEESQPEVAEVQPGQTEVVADEPVLEPKVQANDAELAGAEAPVAPVTPEEMDEVNAAVAAEEDLAQGEAISDESTKVTPEEEATINAAVAAEKETEDSLTPDTATVDKEEVEQETTVTVGPTSININVPITNPEMLTHGLTGTEGEALQEALRTVYSILISKKLNEEETVAIPTDAEAKVEYNEEEGKVVIEIPTSEEPKETITSEENKELQEAIAVIEYVLREEKDVDDLIDQTSEMVEETPSSEETPETVEIPTEVEAEVKKSENSIRIEIPVKAEHKEELSIDKEDEVALQEAFRLVYSIFKAKNLTEAETVEVPVDTEAEVKKEGDKIVIEIDIESPKEKISEEEAEVLQEAINFLSYIFLNEAATDSSAAKAAKFAGKTAAFAGVPTAGLYTAGRLAQGKELMAPFGGGMFTDPNSAFYIPATFDASRHVPMISDTIAKGGEAVLAASAGAAEAISAFVGSLPLTTIAAALAIPLATAAIWSRTKTGKKFIATKLGWGKLGAAFKDKKQVQIDSVKAKIGGAVQKKIAAQKEFSTKQGGYRADEKEAGKGANWLNKLGAKIPILNKLGDLNLFGWRPFQNKDLQDKIATMKADVQTKYKTSSTPGLEFKNGRLSFSDAYAGLAPAEQAAAEKKMSEYNTELRKTGSFTDAIDTITKAHATKVADNKIATATDKTNLNTKLAAADKEVETQKAIMKDKNLDDLLYHQAQIETGLEEFVKFDVDAAYDLLEGKNFTEEEKLDIITEAYKVVFLAELKEQVISSGFNTSSKGVSLFLESQGVKLLAEETHEISNSINSSETKDRFEKYYTSKNVSEVKSPNIENKDIGFGETLNDLVPAVIKESTELGSAAAEPIATSDAAAKEETPSVSNADVYPSEEHKQTEEVKEVIVEGAKSKKVAPKTGTLNTAHSDTLNAEGTLETTLGKGKEIKKAQPKDVTKKYGSLKEAFLLESDYFEKDSVTEVPASAKKEKLVGQLGLLVARDVQDPLYEELIRTSATAKKLQEELQSKYRGVALKKADQFLSAKKSK